MWAAFATASTVSTPFGSSFGSVLPTRIPGSVITLYQGVPCASCLPKLLLGLYPSISGVAANVEYHDTQLPPAAPSSAPSAAAAALTNTSPWRTPPRISLASSVEPPPKPENP